MPLFPIDLASLEKVGIGLARPEDVVVGRDGRVWASDQHSACAEILPDGRYSFDGHADGLLYRVRPDGMAAVRKPIDPR